MSFLTSKPVNWLQVCISYTPFDIAIRQQKFSVSIKWHATQRVRARRENEGKLSHAIERSIVNFILFRLILYCRIYSIRYVMIFRQRCRRCHCHRWSSAIGATDLEQRLTMWKSEERVEIIAAQHRTQD